MSDYSLNVGASSVRPALFRRTLLTNTGILRSPLTGAVQTIARQGSRWQLEMTFRALHGDTLAEFLVFLERLNGAEHRALIHAYDANNRGNYGGSPIVNGGTQTGSSLVLNGATASVTDWAKAGDLIAIPDGVDDKYHQKRVVADASSDGGGNVTLSIHPPLISSPANNAVLKHANQELEAAFILTSEASVTASAERVVSPKSGVGLGAIDFASDISMTFEETHE